MAALGEASHLILAVAEAVAQAVIREMVAQAVSVTLPLVEVLAQVAQVAVAAALRPVMLM
jgi:hypothetical protein